MRENQPTERVSVLHRAGPARVIPAAVLLLLPAAPSRGDGFAGPGDLLGGASETLGSRLSGLFELIGGGGTLQAWLLLLGLSLLFGLVQALRPGNRKLLLLSYFLAEDARPLQGVLAGGIVGVLQVGVAVVLVLLGESVLSAAVPWLQRATGVLTLAVGAVVIVLRVVEALRTREDWREQKYISKLRPVDSRLDPDNEDPAVQLAVAHARKLRRRRRSDAPWLPAVILAGVVPASSSAMLVSRGVASGAPLAGLAAVVAMAVGLVVVLIAISLATILIKERVIDSLGSRAAHFTHFGVEVAGAALLIGLGVAALAG